MKKLEILDRKVHNGDELTAGDIEEFVENNSEHDVLDIFHNNGYNIKYNLKKPTITKKALVIKQQYEKLLYKENEEDVVTETNVEIEPLEGMERKVHEGDEPTIGDTEESEKPKKSFSYPRWIVLTKFSDIIKNSAYSELHEIIYMFNLPCVISECGGIDYARRTVLGSFIAIYSNIEELV